MEKAGEDTALFMSSNSSPRSILGWKDDWSHEGSSRESTSRSSGELPSDAIRDAPKTPPLQLERRLFRIPPTNGPTNSGQRLDGSLSLTGLHSSTDNSKAPVAAEQFWMNSPPSPTLGALSLQHGPDVQGRAAGQPFRFIWRDVRQAEESPAAPLSKESSIGWLSARNDENSLGKSGERTGSVDVSDLSTAITLRPKKELPSNRMKYMTSLNDELNSIKSSVKRALDFGKKVQHYGTWEVSQLQAEKVNAEASLQKSMELNRTLEQQVFTLRQELEELKVDREVEMLAANNEIQELEIERNSLMKVARDEKMKREQLQNEIDSVLAAILEEKMKFESEREAHSTALRSERKKLRAMKNAHDDAVQALQDGTKKLQVERDAMLMAMRDLTSRLDFERDAKLKSMRQTSMDMATMISSFRLSRKNSINKSINTSDDAPLASPLSRRNSRQF